MTRKEMRQLLKERYYLASGKGNRDIRRIRIRDATIGTIFTFTPLLVLTIFVFAAFGIAIWLSFYAGQLDPTLESIKYVGLDNWSRLFNYGSEMFVTAIKNTFLFAGITTGFNIIGALIISSILNSKLVGKRKNLFMVLFFLPQVTSGIASAIIFIRLTGKSSIFGLDLVSNPQDAIWVMIITSIWGGISGGLITFNTAFAGIDSSQYESATLDSASVWMRFRAITIPSLGPILAYTLITSIIGGLGVFDQAYILNVVVPV